MSKIRKDIVSVFSFQFPGFSFIVSKYGYLPPTNWELGTGNWKLFMMSNLIGTIVCGYRIVSEVGEGGMGKVYLAESAFLTEYKQQVAIKTLTSRGVSERQALLLRDLFV